MRLQFESNCNRVVVGDTNYRQATSSLLEFDCYTGYIDTNT